MGTYIHRRTTSLLLRALVLSLTLVLFGSTAQARIAPGASPQPIDNTEDAKDCLEAVPEQVEIPVVGDYTTPVKLEVLFLLNQMEPEEATDIVKIVQEIYAALAIEVVPSFEHVTWEADTSGVTDPLPGAPNEESIGSRPMIELAKEHVGGTRPWGVDVVYALSSVMLTGGVAGQADCIGGVRYDDASFAVGEARNEYRYEDEIQRSARIAAHEIAHLMGAHHHYANCAQGDTLALTRLYGSICTLMMNDLFFVSGLFSSAEAAAVRGHALAYAAETPTEPPAPRERTVELQLKGAKAEGTVTVTDGTYACAASVPVEVQAKSKKGWTTVASVETSQTSWFEAKIGKKPGTYRAVAPATTPEEAGRGETCAAATSKARTRR